MDEIEAIKQLIIDAGPESVGVARQLITYLYVSLLIEFASIAAFMAFIWFGGKYIIDKINEGL